MPADDQLTAGGADPSYRQHYCDLCTEPRHQRLPRAAPMAGNTDPTQPPNSDE
ncbi:Hypothetical protein A7982_07751 [Minicystis rosea]|nr:Hypothetical protein A7982_07751 [Minicystis rosea]